MLQLSISIALLCLALLPALMVLANLPVFQHADPTQQPNRKADGPCPKISVLIPARNEEKSIKAALESITGQTYPNLEVLVLDDHSEDSTAEIVRSVQSQFSFVRLLQSQPLPEGWNGKQFACWQLANAATGEFLLFLDADVRLQPNAIERIWLTQRDRGVDLLSGFPRQQTGTFAERLLIPMMYLVLLAYLPLKRSRQDKSPALAAGCGQLFFVEKKKYLEVGGHSLIAGSRHDGLWLPRTFRAKGATTDLFDASDLAVCRMYTNTREVNYGLLKNATEGIAKGSLIYVFTLLLIGGFVLPVLMFMHSLYWQWDSVPKAILCIASCLSFMPRLLIAQRLEDSLLGVILNPLAVLWFVLAQWVAYGRSFFGLSLPWRGRTT